MKKTMRTQIKESIPLIVTVVIIAAILSFCLISRQHKLYDSSKPNIFEIPGTASSYFATGSKLYEYYFMVQNFPQNNSEVQSMIEDFINDNKGLLETAFQHAGDIVSCHFMFPSEEFPVYFEENKNYFIMDDYVDHYMQTNEKVEVMFERWSFDGIYIFKH